MNIVKHILLVLSALILAACSATKLTVMKPYTHDAADRFSYKVIDNARVSDKGILIFKNRFDEQLSQSGLVSDQANRIIEVTFIKYNMRHGAIRATLGQKAGDDNIISRVIIKNTADGKVLGKITLISKNQTPTGSARGLIEQHVDKIIDYIKTGKP